MPRANKNTSKHKKGVLPTGEGKSLAVPTARCDLTDQFGYPALFDPNDLANSTLFPVPEHFGGRDDAEEEITCFLLIHTRVQHAKRMMAEDWKKCRDTAMRGRGIKPLVGITLKDPDTGQIHACFELKIGGSPKRLLGAKVVVQVNETESDEIEGEKKHVIVFNTLAPRKKRDSKTRVPSSGTFAQGLRFPRSSQATYSLPPKKASSNLLPATTHTPATSSFFSKPPAAATADRVPTKAVAPPSTEDLSTGLTETKQKLHALVQAQAQQIQALSEKCNAQAAQLARHPFAAQAAEARGEQAALVQDVSAFVQEMEDFLKTQPEAVQQAHAEAHFVGTVIAAMTQKSPAVYIQMLKQRIYTYALPPAVLEYVSRYVKQHPTLWQLRNHFGLANALKYMLDQRLEKEIALKEVLDAIFPSPSERAGVTDEKEEASSVVATHFASLESILQQGLLPAAVGVEIERCLHALRAEIPHAEEAEAEEDPIDPEQDMASDEEAYAEEEALSPSLPAQATPAQRVLYAKQTVLGVLKAQAAQLRCLAIQADTQAEQCAKYDLAAKHRQQTGDALRSVTLGFFKSVWVYLETQPKMAWAANAALGFAGEALHALLEGPAPHIPVSLEDVAFASSREITKPGGFLRGDSFLPPLNSTDYRSPPKKTSRDFLRDNASTETSILKGERYSQLVRTSESEAQASVFSFIQTYIEAHPWLWQLGGHAHRALVSKLTHPAYSAELAVSLRKMLVKESWMPAHLVRKGDAREEGEEKEGMASLQEEQEEKDPGCQTFQLPRVSPHFTGRKKALAQVAKTLQDYSGSVIAASSGTGKTQLAAYYAAQASTGQIAYGRQLDGREVPYQAVIWLHAGGGSLGVQFIMLAETWCGLQRPTVEAAMAAVYRYLQDKPTLMVWDDTQSNTGITPYLPPTLRDAFSPTRNFHMLITSQNKDWGYMPPLYLKLFTHLEVLNFVQDVLPGTPEKDSLALLERASPIPLLLSHATAYMAAEGCDVQSYLIQLSAVQARLREKAEFVFLAENPIFYVLLCTLERIVKISPATIYLLMMYAYFAPEEIPVEWLEAEFDSKTKPERFTTEERQTARMLLQSYALLQPSREGCLNMHPALQGMLRTVQYVPTQEQKGAGQSLQGILCERYISEGQQKEIPQSLMSFFIDMLFPHGLGGVVVEGEPQEETSPVVPHFLAPHLSAITMHYFLLDMQDSPFSMQVEIYTQLGDYYMKQLGLARKAGHLFERALERVEKAQHLSQESDAKQQLEERQCALLVRLGKVHQDMGCLYEAHGCLKKALAIQEKRYGAGSANEALLPLLTLLLEVCEKAGRVQNVACYLERIVNIQQALPKQQNALISSLYKLGEIYTTLAEAEEMAGHVAQSKASSAQAKFLLKQALSLQKTQDTPDPEKRAWILEKLGDIHLGAGELKEAETALKQVLHMRQAQCGQEDQRLVSILLSLGCLYALKDQLMRGQGIIERALGIARKQMDRDPEQVLDLLVTLSEMYAKSKNFAAQQACLEEVLLAHGKRFQQDYPQIVFALESLGRAYGATQDYLKQVHCLKSMLAIKEDHLGYTPDRLTENLIALASAYTRLEKRAHVVATARRIYRIWMTHPEAGAGPANTQACIDLLCTQFGLGLVDLQHGYVPNATKAGQAAAVAPHPRDALFGQPKQQAGVAAAPQVVKKAKKKKKKKEPISAMPSSL